MQEMPTFWWRTFLFNLIITIKSTITPYEIEKVCEKVGMDSSKLTFNPEFLREGTAVEDFFKPDRIVLGGTDSEKLTKLKLFEICSYWRFQN